MCSHANEGQPLYFLLSCTFFEPGFSVYKINITFSLYFLLRIGLTAHDNDPPHETQKRGRPTNNISAMCVMHPNSGGVVQNIGEPLSSDATEGESLFFLLRNTFF